MGMFDYGRFERRGRRVVNVRGEVIYGKCGFVLEVEERMLRGWSGSCSVR